jgi:hypothetical protein
VIDAAGVTLENLELTGSHIDSGSGENGAAIRVEDTGLTVRGCFIHDNQDGILATPSTAGSTLLVEATELYNNGMGNGCDDGNGCTHNIYIGNANYAKVTFQYNWSHHLAMDTPDKGHLFKSRALATYVLYNRFTGEGDTSSYDIDIPRAAWRWWWATSSRRAPRPAIPPCSPGEKRARRTPTCGSSWSTTPS